MEYATMIGKNMTQGWLMYLPSTETCNDEFRFMENNSWKTTIDFYRISNTIKEALFINSNNRMTCSAPNRNILSAFDSQWNQWTFETPNFSDIANNTQSTDSELTQETGLLFFIDSEIVTSDFTDCCTNCDKDYKKAYDACSKNICIYVEARKAAWGICELERKVLPSLDCNEKKAAYEKLKKACNDCNNEASKANDDCHKKCMKKTL